MLLRQKRGEMGQAGMNRARQLYRVDAMCEATLAAYERERYLRTARVTITSRIFGDIIHADGGGRDLRNHLLAQRTPETFWEIDWLYRGIEA